MRKAFGTKKKNPALAYSEAKQFLAYKDDEIVGRIAVMINHKEAQELGIEKVRFRWLDFIDDEAVSKALIDTAIAYAKEKTSKNRRTDGFYQSRQGRNAHFRV